MFFPAGASAPWAALGNNLTFTLALVAGGGINETTKEAALDSTYLAGTIAVGTSAWLATRFSTGTVA